MARGGLRKTGRASEAKVGCGPRTAHRGALLSRRLYAVAPIVALAAALLITVVGVLCLLFPEAIVYVLPYLLGFAMVFAGVAGIVSAVRDGLSSPPGADGRGDGPEGVPSAAVQAGRGAERGDAPAGRGRIIEEESRGVGASFVLAVLGAFSIACGDRSIGFLGVAWGLITLYKLGGEVDEIVCLVRAKKPVAIVSTVVAVFELVLALLLILAPFENIEHHVIVLGIELVLNPFKLHWERGRRGAAIDA